MCYIASRQPDCVIPERQTDFFTPFQVFYSRAKKALIRVLDGKGIEPQVMTETRHQIDKTVLTVFLLPFIIGGCLFSAIGWQYLDGLPAQIVNVADRALMIFTAFLDMGTAVGVSALFILYVYRNVLLLAAKVRK